MIHNSKLPPYINDLINARIEAGYSQKDFAKRIGVSPFHLNVIENDKKKAGREFLSKACDELGLEIRLIKK